MRRLLAVKTMIEQGYLDDVENICVIFENLDPIIKNEICNEGSQADEIINQAEDL